MLRCAQRLSASSASSSAVSTPSTQLARRGHNITLSPRRTYAVSVKPPVIYEGKTLPRTFNPRKTQLYSQYTKLLESTATSPLLFLQHTDFRAESLIRLRRQIAEASAKHAPANVASSTDPAKQVRGPPQQNHAELTVLRTSIFGVALRAHNSYDDSVGTSISGAVKGGLCVLSLPSLNPPQLLAVIRAFERAVPKKPVDPSQTKDGRKKTDDENPTPGRRLKRVKVRRDPSLTLLGAVIEGKYFAAEGVKDVAMLPPLETLHAQIVGLLSSPAMQLAAVLSQASGGHLARTLEGLKKGLEEQQQREAP